MQEILEHMGMIHDPRNASYIKHKLSDILFIVMCGVLSGLDSLSEMIYVCKGDFEDHSRALEDRIHALAFRCNFFRGFLAVSERKCA